MATTIDSPASTRRLPRAERREQIVVAAAGVFVQGGFDGTAMDDVARAAGVTRLIVYRIFASKHDLYMAVLTSVADDLRETFSSLRSDEPVAPLLLGVGRRHADAFRLLWRHAAHEPQFAGVAATFRVVVDAFAEERLAMRLDDEVLRHWAARSVVAHLWESVCLWLDDGSPERDDEVAHALGEGTRAMIAAWARDAD
ncbi:MAG: TetR/AcrR family transcriptional regulator [Ilumatobacteraceae bacterium]